MRAAVVGHVEWLEFVAVDHVPSPGEIVAASETWEEAAGGGVVAAVQLSRLADTVHFFTALGGDDLGRRSKEALVARGIEVHAAFVEAPQRRGFTYVDSGGERTITTIGDKLHPRGHDDSLPWHELARCDAVYLCAGDVDALVNARRARTLVATARELATLATRRRRARRARRQREGRERAVPTGRYRSRAAAHGHDVRGARRVGAARRPVLGRAAPGDAGRLVRRRRLLRRRPRVRARRRSRHCRRPRVRRPVRRRRDGRRGGARRADRLAVVPLSPGWGEGVAQWVEVG